MRSEQCPSSIACSPCADVPVPHIPTAAHCAYSSEPSHLRIPYWTNSSYEHLWSQLRTGPSTPSSVSSGTSSFSRSSAIGNDGRGRIECEKPNPFTYEIDETLGLAVDQHSKLFPGEPKRHGDHQRNCELLEGVVNWVVDSVDNIEDQSIFCTLWQRLRSKRR